MLRIDVKHAWYPSPAEAQEAAERWSASVDRAGKLGSVHHTVPRLYLKNFANPKGQILVRDRETGDASIRKIDLGITDFYTFVAKTANMTPAWRTP
ncbi:DUF4238 domain-containing protein [Pseudosporangium ferrugineum]|uniref:DUF4238 domain-containing protein n=1 Tax=Pseudosporangium ferrugineum TaxID=439699 RepID=UPI001304B87E|nr:DUF4238 domain-containing protein [Pseudosporangium ferrugineum]